MRNVWKNGKNLWDGKYRSITSWIYSNMEMESHILGTPNLRGKKNTIFLVLQSVFRKCRCCYMLQL